MTDYFGSMPPSSLNVGKVIKWVQEQTNTFYRSITLRGELFSSNWVADTEGWKLYADGRAEFNGAVDINGQLDVGVGGDSQIFIHGDVQQLNILETDDPDYPDKIFILDVEAGVGRLFWADNTGVTTSFTGNLRFGQDGEVRVIPGPLTNEDGSASAPSIRRDATTDGFYFEAGVVGVAIAGAEKMEISASGVNVNAEPAYLYKETIYYTSDNTFTKADYPGLRAIRVRMVGAGGGTPANTGDTAAGQCLVNSGGGGASYAESWILAADLDTTEAVTVGVGVSGAAGEDSVFDTISGEVRATGGAVGNAGSAATALSAFANGSGPSASGSAGDLIIRGLSSDNAISLAATRANPGGGGNSFLGMGARQAIVSTVGQAGAGIGFGGGSSGSGLGQSQSTNLTAAAGADGIVIVDVYV